MIRDKTAIRVGVENACIHCGQSVPRYLNSSRFCCSGCETVHRLLMESGFDRFYELKPSKILPKLNYFNRLKSLEWINTLPGVNEGRITLDVEGMQCAACVWVIKELAKQSGPAQILVDTSLGRLHLRFVPGQFSIANYLARLQLFGYRTSPPQKREKVDDRGLLLRLGICMAIALNTVFLSVCFYLGLGEDGGPLFDLFVRLNFYQSFIAVAAGGSYFFHRAYLALRRKILHFDLPIAIGILAAFTGSTYSYFTQRREGLYFDTLSLFIALMVLGRYLQQRFLQKNRNALLSEGELKDLSVTRIGETVEEISFSQVKKGDSLLIQPGGIVPVDCTLVSAEPLECDLSWMTGESAPVVLKPGQTVPAGALLLSRQAGTVDAVCDFDRSLLVRLLPSQMEEETLPFVWQWVTRWYVILVLSAATIGFAAWSLIDPSRALFVFVGILVVTCPCSFGIAIPLARTMANKALVLRGVFSRDGMLPDKLWQVKKILLDKTGTLTLAGMVLEDPRQLEAMSNEELQILFNAVVRSRHPASQAIYRHLQSKGLGWQEIQTREIPGKGIEVDDGVNLYRVGRFEETKEEDSSGGYTVDFSRNETLLVRIGLKEVFLDEAPEILENLMRCGFSVYQLSGDKKKRVREAAVRLGIPPGHSFGELSPDEKGRIVADLDCHDTLMLGDGLNDAPALARAWLSGSPVWERSVVAHRAGFFFISGSLRWLADSFQISHRLKKCIQVNLVFTAVYNLGAAALALGGLISPLVCAILMPASSLLSVGWTAAWMRKGIKA